MEDLFGTFSANQSNDDYCDVLVWADAYERRHKWWTACKHCFMICKTISFVSWLMHKCYRRKFLDLFGDVCSLNMCFSLQLFWLLYCIMPCGSSGRFYCATRYNAYFTYVHVLIIFINVRRVTQYVNILCQKHNFYRHLPIACKCHHFMFIQN